MNNDETKKKITEILRLFEGRADWLREELADALIAAGIGDVKEAEAEANRYEMLYKMQSRDMALLERKVHEEEHRAKVLGRTLAIMKGKGLISGVVDDYIVQAEKELAEERKDEGEN